MPCCSETSSNESSALGPTTPKPSDPVASVDPAEASLARLETSVAAREESWLGAGTLQRRGDSMCVRSVQPRMVMDNVIHGRNAAVGGVLHPRLRSAHRVFLRTGFPPHAAVGSKSGCAIPDSRTFAFGNRSRRIGNADELRPQAASSLAFAGSCAVPHSGIPNSGFTILDSGVVPLRESGMSMGNADGLRRRPRQSLPPQARCTVRPRCRFRFEILDTGSFPRSPESGWGDFPGGRSCGEQPRRPASSVARLAIPPPSGIPIPGSRISIPEFLGNPDLESESPSGCGRRPR